MMKMPKIKQKASLGTVALAALVGGIAGAAVGLMFAPKSGKALRQDIHEKADNALQHVENATQHHAGTLKQQGTDLVDKGKQLAEDLQAFIQESLGNKKSKDIPTTIAEDIPTAIAEEIPPVIAEDTTLITENTQEESLQPERKMEIEE